MTSLLFILLFFTFGSHCSNLRSAVMGDEKCEEDRDCVQNAECSIASKTCECRLGFVSHQGDNFVRCLKEATYMGEECSKDIQCQIPFGSLAECHFDDSLADTTIGRCRCQENCHLVDGLCYKNSYIGGRCRVNDNCVIKSKHLRAYCVRGMCLCPPHYQTNGDGTDCVPMSGLGEGCSGDGDCFIPNTVCLSTCRCKPGYVYNRNKTHCLKGAKSLNDECDEDRQCTEFLAQSICHSQLRRCVCAPYAHALDKEGPCWITVGLKEECDHNEECQGNPNSVNTTQCVRKKCQCIEGFRSDQNRVCVKGGNGSSAHRISLNILLLTIYSIWNL